MRMWMVPPQMMCRKHLLGEHVEIHMMVGSIEKRKSLDGFLLRGLLQPSAVFSRHAELVREMAYRGYNHRSPLPDYVTMPEHYMEHEVDVDRSLRDLAERCSDCADRQRRMK